HEARQENISSIRRDEGRRAFLDRGFLERRKIGPRDAPRADPLRDRLHGATGHVDRVSLDDWRLVERVLDVAFDELAAERTILVEPEVVDADRAERQAVAKHRSIPAQKNDLEAASP